MKELLALAVATTVVFIPFIASADSGLESAKVESGSSFGDTKDAQALPGAELVQASLGLKNNAVALSAPLKAQSLIANVPPLDGKNPKEDASSGPGIWKSIVGFFHSLMSGDSKQVLCDAGTPPSDLVISIPKNEIVDVPNCPSGNSMNMGMMGGGMMGGGMSGGMNPMGSMMMATK
jgi:hypothetical protein